MQNYQKKLPSGNYSAFHGTAEAAIADAADEARTASRAAAYRCMAELCERGLSCAEIEEAIGPLVRSLESAKLGKQVAGTAANEAQNGD